MAQAMQTTTTTQRAAAYADAHRDHGGGPVNGTRILSRAASAWANESPDDPRELTGLSWRELLALVEA